MFCLKPSGPSLSFTKTLLIFLMLPFQVTANKFIIAQSIVETRNRTLEQLRKTEENEIHKLSHHHHRGIGIHS